MVTLAADLEEAPFARSLAPATLLWLATYRKHQPELFSFRG
jgi:hypothetical protein